MAATIATNRLRAVLFDATGTLFSVRGSVGALYAQQALACGLPPRPDLADLLERRFHEEFRRMPAPGYRVGEPRYNDTVDRQWWRLLVNRVLTGLGPLDFEPFFASVYELFARSDVWELYPEVPAVLGDLRNRGLRLAIVSNFDARLLPVCEGLGLHGIVDTIVHAAMAGAAKPDTRIFRYALDCLGATAAEALHVGDSLQDDVEGALHAGLRALWVQRHPSASTGTPAGVRVVSELRQLLAALER